MNPIAYIVEIKSPDAKDDNIYYRFASFETPGAFPVYTIEPDISEELKILKLKVRKYEHLLRVIEAHEEFTRIHIENSKNYLRRIKAYIPEK